MDQSESKKDKDVGYYLGLVRHPEAEEFIKKFLEIEEKIAADSEKVYLEEYRQEQEQSLRNLEEMGEKEVALELRNFMQE